MTTDASTFGTSTFSVPVTLGDLTSGQVAYIAEITATNYSDPSLAAPLAIDPSITLTGLYPGVTVSSTSCYNYAAPVPLPPAQWFFVSGLIGLAVFPRSKSAPAKRRLTVSSIAHKIGLDVALEALREAWRTRRFTMDELDRYASICRLHRVMRLCLEALVA